MTDNYLQWFNYHVKKRTSKHIKAEHGESSPDLTEDTLPSVIQKHRVNSVQDLEADHPKKRAQIDQPEPITENDEAMPDIPRHPLPECEPTLPPCADKGKDKEVTTIEIRNPLSNVVLKPRPKPVNQITPSISINSLTASTSGTTSILAPPTPPSCTDSASLAIKAELINQARTMIVIESKPTSIKKRQPSTKPMCVSPKITAQNLCTLEWQSNSHQKEPASVFTIFWNSLLSTDKEAYKCKAVQQLQSAGLPATINDADEE